MESVPREKANVLGAIDMDMSHMELKLMKRRTAENVKRLIRDWILFRHGTPNHLHGDHAKKLIGSVMTTLANMFGVMRTVSEHKRRHSAHSAGVEHDHKVIHECETFRGDDRHNTRDP